MNRIRLTKMENINEPEISATERGLLKESFKGGKLKVYLWEENPGNIPDTEDLKLMVLKSDNREVLDNLLKTKGQSPRVYRNTLFFSYPLESERTGFINTVKHKLACEYIDQDKTINLSEDQM